MIRIFSQDFHHSSCFGRTEKFAETYSPISPVFPPPISRVKSQGPWKTQCLIDVKNEILKELPQQGRCVPELNDFLSTMSKLMFLKYNSALTISDQKTLISSFPPPQFLFYFFIFLVFCLFRAAAMAHGGPQTRGRIRATAVGLHHSHSSARSKPHLRPIP